MEKYLISNYLNFLPESKNEISNYLFRLIFLNPKSEVGLKIIKVNKHIRSKFKKITKLQTPFKVISQVNTLIPQNGFTNLFFLLNQINVLIKKILLKPMS